MAPRWYPTPTCDTPACFHFPFLISASYHPAHPLPKLSAPPKPQTSPTANLPIILIRAYAKSAPTSFPTSCPHTFASERWSVRPQVPGPGRGHYFPTNLLPTIPSGIFIVKSLVGKQGPTLASEAIQAHPFASPTNLFSGKHEIPLFRT